MPKISVIIPCYNEEKNIRKCLETITRQSITDCEVIFVSNQTGTQTTELHQNSSWSYSFNAKRNQEVILLAYNTSSYPQGVTATIKLNDAVLQTQTYYCQISGLSFCADTVR